MARTSSALPASLAAALVLAACGNARNVAEGGESGHPDGYAAPGVHGPEALAGIASCQGCHGATFDGALGPSCNACHATAGYASWASNCTFCHGQKVTSYTPADLPKAAPATGAHAKHVNGGFLTGPIACGECHGVPTTVAHVNGAAPVVFGALASTGPAPAPSFASPTCSSVYCHGKTLEGPTTPNPSWNGAGMLCGSCHNLTPTSGQHTFHVQTRGVACQTCHKGYPNTDLQHHVSGTSEAVVFDDTVIPGWEPADCTACHAKLGV